MRQRGLDSAALESAGLASAGADGLVCADTTAAKKNNTKAARKIRFMLDLTTLELIPRELFVLELSAPPEP
jgi:hypothetical protein